MCEKARTVRSAIVVYSRLRAGFRMRVDIDNKYTSYPSSYPIGVRYMYTVIYSNTNEGGKWVGQKQRDKE